MSGINSSRMATVKTKGIVLGKVKINILACHMLEDMNRLENILSLGVDEEHFLPG
jgi:hypothetical protein